MLFFSFNLKSAIENLKFLACQLKARKLDPRVVGLLKCHLHFVTELDAIDSLPTGGFP